MERLGAVDVHIFDPVSSRVDRLWIDTAIGFGGVLRLGRPQEQRGANDQRTADTMAPSGVFAINVETEVARFLVRMPLEKDRAIRSVEGMEGRKTNGGGRLNCGCGGGGVVSEARIRRGACDRGGIRRERAGAE